MDDDSAVVRREVGRAFAQIGPELERHLTALGLSPPRLEAARELAEEHLRQELREAWPGWRRARHDKARLEAGLSMLAAYQSRSEHPAALSLELDSLADEYRRRESTPHPLTLSEFLFRHKGLHGAREDYYNPDNSNLLQVLKEGRGLPISLCCIYILIGYRLSLNIEGINFPGHFLACARLPGGTVLVDCYSEGRVLEEESLRSLDPRAGRIRDEYADAESILSRVLRNLERAYQLRENWAESRLMADLSAC